MPTTIKIGDLPAAVVFAALYNNAVVSGFDARLPIDGHMSVEQAQSIIGDRSRASYIDMMNGRVIAVDFSKDEFYPSTYNEANHPEGGPLAEQIINHIRRTLTPDLLTEATRDFWVPVPS